MLKKAEGIIVRILKYGESSMILDIFSPEQGIRSYIIGGVRGPKSKSRAAMIRVLNLVRIQAYDKGGDKLNRIKEIEYNYIYKSIPFDVVKGLLASFLIEISRKSIRASDAYEDIYHYIVKGLIHLDNMQSGLAHFHIHFLIGLTEKLGFQMNNNYDAQHPYFHLAEGAFVSWHQDHRYALDAQTSQHLSIYLSQNTPLKISKRSRLDLVQAIVSYYRYHISEFGELKTLPIIISLYE